MDTLQTLSLLAKPILSRYDRCWFVDPAPMPLTLYDFALSGNCHKIRLMLSFLDLSYIKIPTSVKSGETRTPEFLQINPFGQVPVLVDQDCTIRDSLAILVYLVRKYANDQHWLPQSPAEMAQVLSWVAVGNVEVQNSIAQQWLACSVPTIADIACFPYIALAGDAQLSLDKFSHVRRWLRDFQQLKGYVSMAGIPEF
jgi:glutathione S-transferase